MSSPTQSGGNTIGQSLLPEIDHELANTRKTLERTPDDKFAWKPHPKSPDFGWMAGHIANLIGWAPMMLKTDSFDVNPPGGQSFQLPKPANREEVLAIFDKNAAEMRAAIAQATDTQMMEPWSLLAAGKTIFTMPRIGVIRSMILNHIVHHRAQFTVYLRMNDIPVPALYGPSADEGAM